MADNKYKVIPTAATELAQYEKYSAEDTNLIESFGVNSAFNSQKHVSELHIYTVGNTLLRSISSYTNYKIELGSGGSEEGSSTISVDPENGQAFFNHGVAMDMSGDLNTACADWDKAGKLGDESAIVFARKNCN